MVALGLGALVYKGLSDASLYFRNADEAVAQRDSLGDQALPAAGHRGRRAGRGDGAGSPSLSRTTA